MKRPASFLERHDIIKIAVMSKFIYLFPISVDTILLLLLLLEPYEADTAAHLKE